MTIFNTRDINLNDLQTDLMVRYEQLHTVTLIVPSLQWTIRNMDRTAPLLDFVGDWDEVSLGKIYVKP